MAAAYRCLGGTRGMPEHLAWKNTRSFYRRMNREMPERWRTFIGFISDVGPQPTPDHILTRSVTGCRWISREEWKANLREIAAQRRRAA